MDFTQQNQDALLQELNQFTRRTHTLDEVYLLDVLLCDNEVDRDFERFSDSALETLKTLFVGKTGIFDHDPSGKNQTARIFSTRLETHPEQLTSTGVPYTCLKANAYMVRTAGNADFIREIDAGIKKEVSISCSARSHTCSICGKDRRLTGCPHVQGELYQGMLCHTILSDITDAYEWSFVAVPAQVNAGVTKRMKNSENIINNSEICIRNADNELRRDIRRLAFFSGGKTAVDNAMISAENMNTIQLINMKKSFEKRLPANKIEVQLMPENDNVFSADEFSMK